MRKEAIIFLIGVLLTAAVVFSVIFLSSSRKKPITPKIPKGENIAEEIPPENLPPPPIVINKISGKITSIDLAENSLKIVVGNPIPGEYKVIISPVTEFLPLLSPGLVGGSPSSLKAVKIGDYAEVETVENISKIKEKIISAIKFQLIRL